MPWAGGLEPFHRLHAVHGGIYRGSRHPDQLRRNLQVDLIVLHQKDVLSMEIAVCITAARAGLLAVLAEAGQRIGQAALENRAW